ncbi:MAG: hypothetical protein FWG68_05905 [Defluviitaleaceae bacterium]|nr:hypothetical protein [Defluviitaleaceae bacterium]
MQKYIGAFFLVIIGLAVRIAMILIDMPFTTDVRLIQSWAVLLNEGGFANFYYSDAHTDYPPAYMYILFLVGAIRAAFGWDFLSIPFNMVTFAPPIIADIVTGLVIYAIARDVLEKPQTYDKSVLVEEAVLGKSFLVGLAYMLNPAVVLNSAWWGQVDAVHTMLLFLALYAVYKKQILPVYMLYGLAVLTKPQSLVLAPIFLYSVFYYCQERNFTAKSVLTVLGYGVATFAFMALLSLPFGLSLVIEQYTATMGQFMFNSVNAYNFNALTGGTWQAITPFNTLMSVVAIVGVTVFSFWILHNRWSETSIFAVAALLFVVTFVFSVRMHERHVFPAVAFLAAAALFSSSKKMYLLYFVFSATIFINCLDVLLVYRGINVNLPFFVREAPPGLWRPIDEFVAFISFINVCFAVFFIRTSYFVAAADNIDNPEILENAETVSKTPKKFEMVDKIGEIKTVDKIDKINKVEKINKIDEINEIDEIDEIVQFHKSHKIIDIDDFDGLEEFRRLRNSGNKTANKADKPQKAQLQRPKLQKPKKAMEARQ